MPRLPSVHAVRRLFIAAPLTMLLGMPAAAQDTAVVFVHGIQSNGSVWNYAAGTLQQQLRIVPLQPSLDWLLSAPTQAGQLASFVDSDPATSNPARRMPFVGRSNGGLVSREYSRAGGRLSQIGTVATPHQGATLANNWISYGVPTYALSVLNALYTPLDFYDGQDPDTPLLIYLAANAMAPLANLANNLDGLMCPVAGMCLIWDGANYVYAPVVSDLAVGSQATAVLNAGPNLTQEAGTIQRRVGLWTEANPYGALFRLISSDAGSWMTARDIAAASYIAGYQYYHDHWDPYLRAWAGIWVGGAGALIDIDAEWQALIGTLVSYDRYIDLNTGNTYINLVALANDGVVPASSAQYPGGTRSAAIPGDLVHTEQAESPAVVSALYAMLNGDFGIPPRTTTPPPPTYGAQIQGPQAVRPWDSCYWYTSSDVPDPSYEWSVDGIPVASGTDLFYSAPSSFTLSVQVWNSSGDGATASLYVDVNAQNGECAIS